MDLSLYRGLVGVGGVGASSGLNLSRYSDMSREDQTDALKVRLYDLVKRDVQTNWPYYYPACKGDKQALEDLASEFWEDFITPRSRVKGQEKSLLDRFEPERQDFDTFVEYAVIRKLIDKSRGDRGVQRFEEKFDPETEELTIDYLSKDLEEVEDLLERHEFTEDEIFALRDLFDEMSDEDRALWLKAYNKCKEDLAPNYRELFRDLVQEPYWENYTADIIQNGYDFIVVLRDGGRDVETKEFRARNMESAKRKVQKLYPDLKESQLQVGGEAVPVTSGVLEDSEACGRCLASWLRASGRSYDSVKGSLVSFVKAVEKEMRYPTVRDSVKPLVMRRLVSRMSDSKKLRSEMTLLHQVLSGLGRKS